MQVLWAQGWRNGMEQIPASLQKKWDKPLFPLPWLPGQQQEKGIHGSKAANSVEVELPLLPAWVILNILDLFYTPGHEFLLVFPRNEHFSWFFSMKWVFLLVFPWNEWEPGVGITWSNQDRIPWNLDMIQALLPGIVGILGPGIGIGTWNGFGLRFGVFRDNWAWKSSGMGQESPASQKFQGVIPALFQKDGMMERGIFPWDWHPPNPCTWNCTLGSSPGGSTPGFQGSQIHVGTFPWSLPTLDQGLGFSSDSPGRNQGTLVGFLGVETAFFGSMGGVFWQVGNSAPSGRARSKKNKISVSLHPENQG